MTIIGNNNAYSADLANFIGLQSNGSTGSKSFLDIISMLSSNLAPNFEEMVNSSLAGSNENLEPFLLNSPSIELLKNFFDENGLSASELSINSKDGISEEFAAKFSELYRALNNSGHKTSSLVNNSYSDPPDKILPAEKLLMGLMMYEIKEHLNFDENTLKHQITENSSIVAHFDSADEMAKLPKVTPFIFNNSILGDETDKTVVIDLDDVIQDIPNKYDGFKITKIFAPSADDITASDKETDIARLKISLRPGVMAIDLDVNDNETIKRSLISDKSQNSLDEVLVLGLEKPKNTILITDVVSENFRDIENFPKKVCLKFSKSQTVLNEPNPILSFVTEFDLEDSTIMFDNKHAAVLTKSYDTQNNDIETKKDVRVQIFMPKLEKGLTEKNSIQFVHLDDLTEDYLDKFSRKLNAVVSGGYDNKRMLSQFGKVIKDEIVQSLFDEGVKSPLSSFLTSIIRKPKAKLMISTADVIGYRENIKLSEKSTFDFQLLSSVNNLETTKDKKVFMDLAQTKGNSLSSDKIEAKINSNNVIDLLRQPNQNPQTGIALRQNIINPNFNGMLNHINIYDAQFSSRLGMLLADQISSGTENFEIQLEPESFGRVRVNVSLESSNVEVKMLADNNAAVLALRGSENMLQNIAEQNGLKLSDYSVGMQNNQNGDGSGRKSGADQNATEGSDPNEIEQEQFVKSPDDGHKLNLLA